jgi:hypothetical protein
MLIDFLVCSLASADVKKHRLPAREMVSLRNQQPF